MKNGIIILISCMIVAIVWRAPAVIIDPATGAIYMPNVRFDFENAFSWAVMAILGYYIAYRYNLWVGLFLILATFSAFYPANTSSSERAQHFVFYGVIWYIMCCHFTSEEKYQQWAMNGICIVALIHILFVFMQGFFDYDPFMQGIAPLHNTNPNWDRVPNVGLMSCVNGAASMLAITMPAFFRRGWKWCLILFIPSFILTHSFVGPLAAVAVTAGWVSSVHKLNIKKLIIVSIVCLACLLSYIKYVDPPDPGWRYKTWKAALVGTDHGNPYWYLRGIGIGHWKLVFSRKDVGSHTLNQFFTQAHNEIIQGQTEMGIGFSVLLIGFLGSAVIRMHKKSTLPSMALVALLITSNTFFTFHIALIAMVGILWLALLKNTLSDYCLWHLPPWLSMASVIWLLRVNLTIRSEKQQQAT